MRMIIIFLVFSSSFIFSVEYSEIVNLLNKNKINKFLKIEPEKNRILNIINIEQYNNKGGDKLLFFLNSKLIYEEEGKNGEYVLQVREEYIENKTFIFTEWGRWIYATTKIYSYEDGKIKKIFDFGSLHVEDSYIIFNEEEREVQLIIPCKEGHAMPTDTYIYKYDKQSNKFVLKRIIKRDIKEEDDPQIIKRKR